MKMRKKLITALVLGACVGTQAFAQNTKQDTITFALTVQGQSSVSTSTVANQGNWDAPPTHYKTKTTKLTQTDIIRSIGYIMSGDWNPSYYSTKASLVLVQGELSGFFTVDEDLALDRYVWPFHDDYLDGEFYSYDSYPDTSISAGGDTFVVLATGRHFENYPNGYPPGHLEPWGQFFVKDPAFNHGDGTYTATDPYCDNVTFFFNLTVQECYDCYYLNSFISDSTFAYKIGNGNGNPCCTTPGNLTGKGVDKYYLTLSFDNTVNNHYLNDEFTECQDYNWFYTGNEGWYPDEAIYNGQDYGVTPDGLTPDSIHPYIPPILSAVGRSYPYEMRFTLNGIFTYTWTLTAVNKGDAFLDFVGTGKYDANGYGFIALDCSLITGTATFTEKVVKDIGCCDDIPWYDEYNDEDAYVGGWYGPGNREAFGNGYYEGNYTDESPLNPNTALTYHNIDDDFIWSWPKPYCNNN